MSLRLRFSAAPTIRSLLPPMIAAGRIEIRDADVGGAFDDAAVGGDHAAEADGRDLEAGLAEGLVAEAPGADGAGLIAGVARGASAPRNERRRTRQAAPGRRPGIGGEKKSWT